MLIVLPIGQVTKIALFSVLALSTPSMHSFVLPMYFHLSVIGRDVRYVDNRDAYM